MRGLFQGGSCNPNAIGASSNQYKRMMDNLQMGGQNAEKVINFAQQGENLQGDIQARKAMFEQMGKNWSGSMNQMEAQQRELQHMMGREFNQSELDYQKHLMEMMHMQQMEMKKAEQYHRMQEQMMVKQFQQATINKQAQMWSKQIKMEKAHEEATVSKEAEQESIMNSSSSMLDVMMNDPDPRFQNSQFLHFLKRIQDKQIIIEGKEIREVKPDQKSMDKNWESGEKQYEQNMKTMEGQYKKAEETYQQQQKSHEQIYEENWAKKLEQYENQYEDHENFQKMLEQKYMEVLKQMNLDLTEAWQSATDLEEQMVHGDIHQTYLFAPENPFLAENNPKEISLHFINAGKNNQAILALQAHLQKNMQDSDSWRILGRILQQNDQDQKSISCFMNSLKHNPENLDSMLSLGVSCTNILDEVKAMNYIKKWIILHPKYKQYKVDPNIIPENALNEETYKIEDIKAMNETMVHVFEDITKNHADDPELLNALAILYFIKREYHRSIDLFQEALKYDPTNYLLMNKVGAALAHLGRADEAIDFYHRALDIRPNYVRVWVNLGIAHGFKGNYDEAARFYLNSLSFRPDAKHVWSYLHTTFMNMQRYDLIKQISTQNPQAFPQFDVINLNQLPEPSLPYQVSTQRHILSRESSAWLNEFKK